MEYLYTDSSGYCFMNSESYEQIYMEQSLVDDVKEFLLPNCKVHVEFHEERPIGIQLPETVDLRVVDTEPQMRGATVSGSGKPATLETGLIVNVPKFIEIGEVVRVSTSSREYQERVKN